MKKLFSQARETFGLEFFEILSVMINVNCLLDKICNHLGDRHVWDSLDYTDVGRPARCECRHSLAGGGNVTDP